ncbi:MAG TPA: DUF4019 domain-containing protein [Candidatus Sulfotelmatobacter sp.]
MSTTLRSSGARILSVSMLALFLAAFSMQAQEKPETLAQQSAERWLELVDSGKFGESWDASASLFKAAVTREQWEHMLHATREPLGKLQSRKLKSATYTKSLPGAPDGEYVVIRYDSSFEHKQSAVETITPMLDKDGIWRVSGYYIK